ncbi:acyl-CoA thioesterase [Yinghuangia seranimata]|uniref:acyl-CoA thioesterase n=1 Tax=Yinghuangia seranimata TaxID=408067 RepID=UPI00248B5092|nr:thioesterase family protein [Yinghuangia seranimata]MDI2129934.1 thioesterase family protein [Yinghuangia seranimata]
MSQHQPDPDAPVGPPVTGQDAAPASVVVERRVEWSDTDAAGHYHFSAVSRWAEAAEAVLLRRLGFASLFGAIPRVHFEADYLQRLWFGETVRIEMRVAKVGVSSLHYAFEIRGREGLAATGRMSIVHAVVGAEGSTPWSDDVRAALTGAGPQPPETYATGPADGAPEGPGAGTAPPDGGRPDGG